VHLGVKFRRILAKRIFRECGKNFKAFHFVKLSFGYNLEVGDDVVIHRHVLLDDRGGIKMGDRVSVSDFANVYSHTHDIVDPVEVEAPRTVIDDGVRITYHSTVLAGVHVAEDSMVGAMALATRDTERHHVHVGIPAKPVKRKPEAERIPAPADPLDEELGDRAPADLTPGQRRRAALAGVMAAAPAVVLLDIPFAGMGRDEARALWREVRPFLTGQGSAVLITGEPVEETNGDRRWELAQWHR